MSIISASQFLPWPKTTVTSVDPDKPVHMYSLIWICTGHITVTKAYKKFLINIDLGILCQVCSKRHFSTHHKY